MALNWIQSLYEPVFSQEPINHGLERMLFLASIIPPLADQIIGLRSPWRRYQLDLDRCETKELRVESNADKSGVRAGSATES